MSHKKKLAVVVADVEEDEYRFERRWYGSNPEQLRGAVGMAHRAAGRGSGDSLRFILHLTRSLRDILEP